ncbi:MAG: DUF4124 domain-containing protein [Pseudomonadota bacterium]|nr:DUF4124 domain-containing protein [Pseudomonadota bacterium]
MRLPPMIAARRLCAMMVALTLPGWVGAQIYVCKDSSGRTITADRPIPECAARPMRELGNNGVTRREIPAPLTPEQKQQRALEAERQRVENEAAMEVRRRDLAMLERFRNENEIHAAHKRAIEDIQQNIKQEAVALAVAEKQLKEAQTESDQRKSRPGAVLLPTRKLEDARSAVATENDLIRQQKIHLLKVDTWFDETLKRYRELNGTISPQ